jgi:hypothetical protein
MRKVSGAGGWQSNLVPGLGMAITVDVLTSTPSGRYSSFPWRWTGSGYGETSTSSPGQPRQCCVFVFVFFSLVLAWKDGSSKVIGGGMEAVMDDDVCFINTSLDVAFQIASTPR